MQLNNSTPQLPPVGTPINLEDLSAFVLPKGQEAIIVPQKLLSQVPVRKPRKDQWVRTVEDTERWKPWMLIELKEESEMYLVTPQLAGVLHGEPTLIHSRLVPYITDAGVVFLWPIRMPDSYGRLNPWHESALRAAEIATKQWVRITANRQLGGYDVLTAQFEKEPAWPNESDEELIKIAFREKFISSMDHPVIRRLKGLA
jgi:hypothetical protein